MGKNPDTAYSLLPTAPVQVDLPIDHFRLLGVSPSAESETILRTMQLRIDRCPDQGFTHEALRQRADLLRLSADLLTDPSRRRDYEAALMQLGRDHPSDAAGLEVASSREVGGLILLWEANAPHEAFQLACQALQPPQAPALGSGREADLALLAALASRAAAEQDQDQRRYESAAGLLAEGLQLLHRVGKLPEQRRLLEQSLVELKPYRILDLLSRDLSELTARREGLDLLDQLVQARGGLEGPFSEDNGLSQGEFELFFQQIRRFLTVQEQVDLYERWQGLGSSDAAFLAVMALSAAGFSRRKPERLDAARQRLRALSLDGLDTHPLQACLDLLLGDVDHAMTQMRVSTDPELQTWLRRHPGDDLAALCDYCRSWLRRDVLPGFRDVDADAVDLEAWFADRDVQAFVERLERIQGRRLPEQPQQSAAWSEPESLPAFPLDPDGMLPLPLPLPFPSPLTATVDTAIHSDPDDTETTSTAGSSWKERMDRFPVPRFLVGRPVLVGTVVFVLVVAVAAASALVGLRRESEMEIQPDMRSEPSIKQEATASSGEAKPTLLPLDADDPSNAQLQALLQAWLDRKAKVLSGGSGVDAEVAVVARDGLVQQVEAERRADAARNERQDVEATISSMEVVSRAPRRIELRAQVAYRDQRLDAAGKVIDRTAPTILPVTYILGRDGSTWRLQAFIPG